MTIAVLMSTYNGEQFVEEQIDSILAQQLEGELRLFIRDDGSTDRTSEIIRQYASEHNNVIFINDRQITNLGIQKSFLTLLDYAYHNTDSDFFAFADQDDVWKEEKLSQGLKLIAEADRNERGVLYYSNKTFVDENLKLIREENIRFYDDIFEVLWKSLAFGCTMIFDHKLAEVCLRHAPTTTIMHDSWVFHIAKMTGSSIVFDPRSFILYRQHGDNTIGIEGAKLYHRDIRYLAKRALPLLFAKRTHTKQKYLEEVYRLYYDLIPEENRRILKDIVNYRTSLAAKLHLIHHPYMRSRDRMTRLVWAYSILANRI